ncbi:hypothetical protein Lal_00040412 [Lupinus albus]|nr:hypothetical protein Lal_00040412 [Lupinus albus]
MANIVATIEYLVHEILLRLPVKSLLRFKCVSKQWLALISEPYFCNSHTLRLYRTSRVFPSSILHALSDSRNCQVIPLKTINVSDSFKFHNVNVPIGMVIQSSNGLLLIQRITLDGDEAEVEYFVCNPTTNKSVPVIFPTQQLSSSVISLFICFEPWKSLHYKLVSFRSKNYESIDDMSSLVISTDIIYNEYQENDKDSLLLIWYNDKVMLYNLVDSTFRDLSSYSPSLMIETSSYFFQHYENLSCVDPIKNMKIDFDVGVVLHGYSHVGERDHTLSVHLVWPDYDRV